VSAGNCVEQVSPKQLENKRQAKRRKIKNQIEIVEKLIEKAS
jgi:hypothetical protein